MLNELFEERPRRGCKNPMDGSLISALPDRAKRARASTNNTCKTEKAGPTTGATHRARMPPTHEDRRRARPQRVAPSWKP